MVEEIEEIGPEFKPTEEPSPEEKFTWSDAFKDLLERWGLSVDIRKDYFGKGKSDISITRGARPLQLAVKTEEMLEAMRREAYARYAEAGKEMPPELRDWLSSPTLMGIPLDPKISIPPIHFLSDDEAKELYRFDIPPDLWGALIEVPKSQGREPWELHPIYRTEFGWEGYRATPEDIQSYKDYWFSQHMADQKESFLRHYLNLPGQLEYLRRQGVSEDVLTQLSANLRQWLEEELRPKPSPFEGFTIRGEAGAIQVETPEGLVTVPPGTPIPEEVRRSAEEYKRQAAERGILGELFPEGLPKETIEIPTPWGEKFTVFKPMMFYAAEAGQRLVNAISTIFGTAVRRLEITPAYRPATGAFRDLEETVSKTATETEGKSVSERLALEVRAYKEWREKHPWEAFGLESVIWLIPWGAPARTGVGVARAAQAAQVAKWNEFRAALLEGASGLEKLANKQIAITVGNRMTQSIDDLIPTYEKWAKEAYKPVGIRKVYEELKGLPGIKQLVGLVKPLASAESQVEKISYHWIAMTPRKEGIVKVLQAKFLQFGKVFGVDSDGFVTNATAKVKGDSLHYLDVIASPDKYNLTAAQKAQAKEIIDAFKLTFKWLKEAKVPVPAKKLPPGTFYIGRLPERVAGETAEAYARRLGVPQPFLRHRHYLTAGEAYEAGVRYMNNPYEAFTAALDNRIQAIIDQRAIDALVKLGKKAIPTIPEQNVKAATESFNWLSRFERTVMNIPEKGLINKHLPKATIISLERRFPTLGAKARAAEATREALLKDIRGELVKTRDRLSRGKEEALLEATYIKPKTEIRGLDYIFPPDVARNIEKLFVSDISKLPGIVRVPLNFAQAMNELFRFTITGFDIGAPFLHGLPMLGRRGDVWAKMVKGQIEGIIRSPENMYRAISKDADFILETIANGASYSTAEFMRGAPLAARIAKIIPIAGKPLSGLTERYARGFSFALDILKKEFLKSQWEPAKRAGKLTELVQFTENVTGTASVYASGMRPLQRTIESLGLWFAPQFTRSFFATIGNIFKGGYTSRQAAQTIAQFLGALTMWQYCSAKLQGKELELNPMKPTFGTIEIGGMHIGPGSPYIAGIRLLGNSYRASVEDPDRLFAWDLSNEQHWRQNPFLKWYRSRMAIFPGLGLDIALGKSFLGEPTRRDWKDVLTHVATRQAPISLKPFLEAALQGKEMPGFDRFIAEHAGLRAWEIPDWEKLTELYATYFEQEKGTLVPGKHYAADGLTELGKAVLRERHPDIKELERKIERDRASRASTDLEVAFKGWQENNDNIRKGYIDRLWELERRAQKGEITTRQWLTAYLAESSKYGDDLKMLEADPRFTKVHEYFAKPKTPKENMALFDRVYTVYQDRFYNNPKLNNPDGSPNFVEINKVREQFIREFGKEAYEYCVTMGITDKDLPPMVKEYRYSRDMLLKDYWQLPRDAIIREDYRKNNPEVDAALFIFGQVRTLKTPQAENIVRNKLNSMMIPLPVLVSSPYDEQIEKVTKRLDSLYDEARRSGRGDRAIFRMSQIESQWRSDFYNYKSQWEGAVNPRDRLHWEASIRDAISDLERLIAEVNAYNEGKPVMEPWMKVLVTQLERDRLLVDDWKYAYEWRRSGKR